MCRAEMFAFSRGSVRLVLCVALCLQLLAAHARRAIVTFVHQTAERGWTIVDMKHDWKVVYPFEKTDKPQLA